MRAFSCSFRAPKLPPDPSTGDGDAMTTISLTVANRAGLAKLRGLLASNYDGERDAAALAATRFL